ncbi:aldo/keto reductase [Corallococcus sp. bb12-1]|uniref:aldo/keto reductase n=1 Tax=Corallococcus sp. bb12-1 TaxID=2996784 RepID=UPI00226EB9E1|nr:aldo/keto reductase [Corallococcus sp. bb12-1]MCY1046870.1 aldo/keto reductase [Corallococcus sp. bb12-1]
MSPRGDVEALVAPGPVGLGLGLLSIGRTWGYHSEPPPPEADARRLLEYAVEAGVRCFDTAPAYGTSEERFGAFLTTLGSRREELLVATKFGEHWDAEAHTSFTDHAYDALRRSLDQSLHRLGRIDLLQVHKATAATVGAPDVVRALEYARSLGITRLGASISDVAAAEAACSVGLYSYLQFPYNTLHRTLEPVFALASRKGLQVLINRPFAMGQLLHAPDKAREVALRESLDHVLGQAFSGFVLTGTKSVDHLRQTLAAFGSRGG